MINSVVTFVATDHGRAGFSRHPIILIFPVTMLGGFMDKISNVEFRYNTIQMLPPLTWSFRPKIFIYDEKSVFRSSHIGKSPIGTAQSGPMFKRNQRKSHFHCMMEVGIR